MHRCGDEFSSSWNLHVRIRVGNDSVSSGIHDLAVQTRIMSSFLFQNFEGTPFGEMPVTAARNWRGQNDPSILQEESHLLFQVNLDRSLRMQGNGSAEEDRQPNPDPHIAFKPARRAKVAPRFLSAPLNLDYLHCDRRFDRWMRVVASEFEIFELEVLNVFYDRIQLHPR